MFVGEAPGADEDASGRPFVGRAGQLLTQWIEHVGLKREDVYIANILKCRPPRNRNPEQDEIDTCTPYLTAQIESISPTVIVALGRYAGNFLVGKKSTSMNVLRMQTQTMYGSTRPVVPTYHPSYVLRTEGGFDPDQPNNYKALYDIRKAMKLCTTESTGQSVSQAANH